MNELEEIAKEKSCTASQVALAWLLSRGDDIVPIPGTKHRKYLQENVRAVDIEFTAEDMNRLTEIAENIFRARSVLLARSG